MYIISVIPISNIPRQEILTYFYKEHVPPGSLVTAPYNRSIIRALVVECTPARAVKGDIKNKIFELKKILSVEHYAAVPTPFIESLALYAHDFFVPLPKILYDIYPKWYWNNLPQDQANVTIGKKSDLVFLENTFEERMKVFETYFSTHDCVWVCLPTVVQVKSYTARLAQAHKNVFAFVSSMTESKQIKQFDSITKELGKKIIVSTPYYAGIFLPMAQVSIIENFGDDGYRMSLPHMYDARALITRIPHTESVRVYTDSLLPLVPSKEMGTVHRLNYPQLMYTLYTKETKRHSEIFIHPVMEQAFNEDLVSGKKIALVTLSADSNQQITCNDCHTVVICKSCATPLTLLRKGKTAQFACSFCQSKISAHQKCTVCESWNLQSLGINTETIKAYIGKTYGVDETARVTIDTFSGITQKDSQSYDSLYIISLDALMHSSDYKAEEKIYRLLLGIQSLAHKISIQTSFPAPNILNTLKTQEYKKWITGEYAKRKKHLFVPFGTTYMIRAKNKKGLMVLQDLEQTCGKKNIRYIRSLTEMTLYIPSTYESSIDTYLAKKITPDLVISKEKSLFSETE